MDFLNSNKRKINMQNHQQAISSHRNPIRLSAIVQSRLKTQLAKLLALYSSAVFIDTMSMK
jgi:hypothetical protein